MKVMLYGDAEECKRGMELLQSFLDIAADADCFRRTDCRDALREQLVEWKPNLIIILADCSNGMEAVYTAKEVHAEIPIFWFSDDVGFGMQSHRLGCDYFAVKPLTVEKLEKAFHRCAHTGTQIVE